MGVIVRNNNTQVYSAGTGYTGYQAPVNTTDQIWQSIFLNGQNGQYFLSRFANQTPGWWRGILYNTHLTPLQKFQQIFGVTNIQATGNTNLLGDILDWLNNLFSNQNLSNAELFLRQGEVQAANIANGLNYIRNQPDPTTQALQQQNSMNLQTTAVNTWQQFWSNWGPLAVIGIVIFLAIKK